MGRKGRQPVRAPGGLLAHTGGDAFPLFGGGTARVAPLQMAFQRGAFGCRKLPGGVGGGDPEVDPGGQIRARGEGLRETGNGNGGGERPCGRMT